MENLSATNQNLRILEKKIENAEKYAVSVIALYNYLHMTNNAPYSPADFTDRETDDGETYPGALRKALTVGVGAGPLRDLPNVRGSRNQTCAVT